MNDTAELILECDKALAHLRETIDAYVEATQALARALRGEM